MEKISALQAIDNEIEYFARAVDDASLSPSHEVMSEAVEYRGLIEALERNLRIGNGCSADLNEDDKANRINERKDYYRPLALGVHFAKAVDDPEAYPPLDEDMAAAIEDRKSTEEIHQILRKSSGCTAEPSDEDRRWNFKDRVHSYQPSGGMTMRSTR